MVFFPPQVCLVMEYAEGGSLYNGESICFNRKHYGCVTCYTIYFALLVMNTALDRHSPVELILQLFARSATFLIR